MFLSVCSCWNHNSCSKPKLPFSWRLLAFAIPALFRRGCKAQPLPPALCTGIWAEPGPTLGFWEWIFTIFTIFTIFMEWGQWLQVVLCQHIQSRPGKSFTFPSRKILSRPAPSFQTDTWRGLWSSSPCRTAELVATHLPLGNIWLHQPSSESGPNLLPEVSGGCTLPLWKQEMVRG